MAGDVIGKISGKKLADFLGDVEVVKNPDAKFWKFSLRTKLGAITLNNRAGQEFVLENATIYGPGGGESEQATQTEQTKPQPTAAPAAPRVTAPAPAPAREQPQPRRIFSELFSSRDEDIEGVLND